jgi:Bacterial SH3 domain
MRRSTNGLRQEAAITEIADIYALASAKQAVASRAVPLELKPLLSPYRKHGRFTLRIENLPQSARLSAGQNNGDRTWSLALDELDDLFFFPPTGPDKEHTIAIRIITKDETGASTIALLNHRISSASEDENALPSQPHPVTQKSEPIELPQGNVLRNEISQLKDALAERDSELHRLRTSTEGINAHLAGRFDASLTAAESVWRRDEALRLNALEAELREEFERKLTEVRLCARADADSPNNEQAAALRNAQLELTTVKKTLANRVADLAKLQSEFERLRQNLQTDVLAAKADAQATVAGEVDRRSHAEKALAELTARYESAEASLALARETSPVANYEGELNQLRSELEIRRQEAEAQISAAMAAAEAGAAERLKAAQSEWEQCTAKELAETIARCESAEAAHAAVRAGTATNLEAELRQLQSEFEVQRREMEAEIEAVKATAEGRAAERLRAEEAQWRQSAAKELAGITARCEAAEAAVIAAREDTQKAEADEYVRSLVREIKTLQATLVDREAGLAQANASLEQLRFGATRETPSLPRLAHPRRNLVGATDQEQVDRENSHLIRDVVIVFGVVMAAVLLFPQFETSNPGDGSWHIDTAGPPEGKTAGSALLTSPATKYPIATILREVNVREQPSGSAEVLASLKSGTQIAVLENRGNWDRVQISGQGGTVRQGWVYHSYLAEAKK